MTVFLRLHHWRSPLRRRPALLLAAALLGALPARAAAPLTEETVAAMGSFMQVCARVLTGGDSLAAALEAGFAEVPAERARAMLRGGAGRVLVAQGPAVGGIVLILSDRPAGCSMRLQRMDVETAEPLFVRLAERVARPGLTVTRAFDGTVPVPNAGPARQITFRVSPGERAASDFALAFTGNADPAAGTQGIFTFGTLAPRR
ncbi:hypothetical protein D9599_01345 [Roseomonas sp. KE2513]|uniref:NMCC_0638 family (lipo)protein n=1 Tax=Roseomonas sp. KE2513 TaxID=2479202 RepID=UPI0018DF948F|nr:hypothetical protein [Roseomonas sp. KE2513]MBI0534219.1 hypothetical protein [Roseomonas sp. KE2513]